MLGPLCNETVNLETDGKTLHYSLRKLMPTWAKIIPYLRIKTLKKQTLLGGGDIPVCTIDRGGSTPQVPPPWVKGLIGSLCLRNETVFLPGKDILLWEEKDWTQESGRH